MRHARLRNGVLSSSGPIADEAVNGTGNGAHPPRIPVSARGNAWSVEAAEDALRALAGIISVRIVQKPEGSVQEIHVLTEADVPPKRTVRRVESALLRKFGLRIDHRKVSVARSRWPIDDKGKKAKSSASFLREPTFLGVDRPHMPSIERRVNLRFDGHEVQLEPSGRMRVRVFLESDGVRYSGEAVGSQKAGSRMNMLASATVDAVQASLGSASQGGAFERTKPSMVLEDVDVVDAFTRDFVLASVSALGTQGATSSAGAAAVEGSLDQAVILSTLQAADRWVRENV